MTDTPEATPAKKVHWATQRRLDIEAAKREGREPPPSPFAAARKFAAARNAQHLKTGHRTADPPVLGSPKLAAHLAGLGPKTCASACSPEKGCAITGDMCGHPYQSGLQAAHKMRPDVVRRHAEAVAHLEHLAIDRKTG